MKGFTKQETYDLLSDYPANTIPMVLSQLGYNENTEEYPPDIVENAEAVYKAMNIASETRKQLAGSTPKNESLTPTEVTDLEIRQTADIAQVLLEAEGIPVDPREFLKLARMHVVQAANLANRISDAADEVFCKTLTQRNEERIQRTAEVIKGGIDRDNQILDSTNIAKLVNTVVPNKEALDLNELLAEVNATSRQYREGKQQKATTEKAAKEKVVASFDFDALLVEMNG